MDKIFVRFDIREMLYRRHLRILQLHPTYNSSPIHENARSKFDSESNEMFH